MKKIPFLVACGLATLSACTEPPQARRTDPLPTRPLSVDLALRTFRDAEGRAVLLRGFNYSGLEFGHFLERPNGPKQSDFIRMRSWGSNVIRLAFAWSYLQPELTRFDPGYLASQLDPVIHWAGEQGMGVILEMHQYYWSPCTGGIGAPAWVCDGYDYSQADRPFYRAQSDFWANAVAQDGQPLIHHYLEAWRMVVERYKDSPHVIGFNFMNEPMDLYRADTFESEALYPFYRRATEMVRGTGAQQLIVLDPPVTRNLGYKMQPEPIGDSNVVYAPHLYTATGGLPDLGYPGDRNALRADYAQALAEAERGESLLWVGEYGGVTKPEFLAKTELLFRHSIEEQNARRLGGAVWAYFPGGNDFSVVQADGTELTPLVDAFATPYPMVTAGTPTAIKFDYQTRTFTFRFSESGAAVPDPTVVFVPRQRHYPQGWQLAVSEGDLAEWNEALSAFLIWRDLTLAEHHFELRPLESP